jgi:hypothetical protein
VSVARVDPRREKDVVAARLRGRCDRPRVCGVFVRLQQLLRLFRDSKHA